MNIAARFFSLLDNLHISRGRGDVIPLLAFGVGVVALFLGLFFSAQAALLLLAAGWLVAGAWRYPFLAFLLLLFFAPLLPLLKATHVLSALTPLKDIVILTLFARTVVMPIFLKTDPYRKNPLLVPLFFFGVWALMGLLRADHFLLGVLRLRDLFLYLPLLWVARSLVRTPQHLSLFLRTLLGSGALTLFLAGVQFLFFPDGMVLRFIPASHMWIPRASGTLAHPNILGSFLLFLIPLATALALERHVHPLRRLSLGALAAAALGALVLTYSRGVWIAMAGAFCALGVLLIIQKRRMLLPLLLSLIIGTMVLFFSVPTARIFFRTVLDPTYASNRERLEILNNLLAESSSASAIVGEGFGDVLSSTMRTVQLSVTDVLSANARKVQIAKARTFVDNAILKTWIEQGVVGVVLIGWVLWHVLRSVWKEQRGGDPHGRALARALGATTIGLMVLSFFLDVPEIFPVALLFWTFVGVLQSVPHLQPHLQP